MLHPAAPPEPRAHIRERAAEHRDAVVDPARVPVQHLLRDERPPVRLLRERGGDRAPALVREVHVPGVPRGDGLARGRGERGELHALVEDEQRGGDADGEGGGGAEAGADGEGRAADEVEGWPMAAAGHHHVEVEESHCGGVCLRRHLRLKGEGTSFDRLNHAQV